MTGGAETTRAAVDNGGRRSKAGERGARDKGRGPRMLQPCDLNLPARNASPGPTPQCVTNAQHSGCRGLPARRRAAGAPAAACCHRHPRRPPRRRRDGVRPLAQAVGSCSCRLSRPATAEPHVAQILSTTHSTHSTHISCPIFVRPVCKRRAFLNMQMPPGHPQRVF